VTDEKSFGNIRNWIRNIEQHATESVNKILVGNKCDMESEKVVETSRGQALADEFSVKFFETSAKQNINVLESFEAIAKDIKKRLMDNPGAGVPGGTGTGGTVPLGAGGAGGGKGKCCK